MSTPGQRPDLAREADFQVGPMKVLPSACRVFAGAHEIRVEAQTMAVLIVLARAGGATVSRDELVAACWRGRVVSDDAIGRTIAKVRALAKATDPAPFTLETVPKVGYRLIPAEHAGLAQAREPERVVARARPGRWRLATIAAGLAIAIPVAWTALPRDAASGAVSASDATSSLPTAAEVTEALMLLDAGRVQDHLDRGWDVNWNLDSESSNAIQTLFMACERNPSHDKAAVVKIARMLVLAGVNLSVRNKWDDSALDIAISPRYCGPHHPVVDYLKSMSPAEITYAAMERACGEAFEGKKTKANWASTNLTREECAAAKAVGLKTD